jgi:CRP-like cAMP-binding protein
MVNIMSDGSGVEAGTVGREGLVGLSTAFDSTRMIERWISQVPGRVARMSVLDFRRHIDADETLRILLQRYTLSFMAALSQSVACNRLHVLVERCARWLLLTHDRVGRDEFMLTQEFMAFMLGVRRPGVSVAAAALQQAGFISYARGHVRILDRAGLESASCECYEIQTREYERLFSQPIKETVHVQLLRQPASQAGSRST